MTEQFQIKLADPNYECWRYKQTLRIYQDDHDALQNFLNIEGWQEHRFLPAGWKFRPSVGPGLELLSDLEQTFPSLSSGLKYIKANCSKDQLAIFKLFINPMTRRSNQIISDQVINIEETNIKKNKTHKKSNESEHFESEIEEIETANDDVKEVLSNYGTTIILTETNVPAPSFIEKSSYNQQSNSLKNMTLQKVQQNSVPNCNLDFTTIPEGWKIRGRSTIVSPNDEVYKGPLQALSHLLNTGSWLLYPETVGWLRSLLLPEGWRQEGLPEGWMARRIQGRGYSFLASDGEVLDKKKTAMNHLIKLDGPVKDQKLIEEFRGWFDAIDPTISSKEVILANNPDEKQWQGSLSLPPDWKMKNGCVVTNAKVQAKPKEPIAEPEYSDWQTHPLLPPGWMVGRAKFEFLAPGGKTFNSLSVAAEYMEEEGSYNDEDIRKIYQVQEPVREGKKRGREQEEATKKARVDNSAKRRGLDGLVLSKPDFEDSKTSSITKTIQINPSVSKKAEIITNVHREFKNIHTMRGKPEVTMKQYQEVLRKGDVNGILRARRYLRERGWSEDDSLPLGWMFRPRLVAGTQFQINFLSETGQHLTSQREAKKYLETKGDKRVLDPAKLKMSAELDPEIEIRLIERGSDTDTNPALKDKPQETEQEKNACQQMLKCDLLSDFHDILKDILSLKDSISQSESIINELRKEVA